MPATNRLALPSPALTVRRFTLLLLIVLPLLVGLLPVSAAPKPAAVGLGDVYLSLGDSLTTGTEAAGNNDGKPGYPNYLYDLLKGNTGLTLHLQGVDGETSSSMRAPGGQLDQALAFIAEQRAAGKVVSPVTIDIGGNDMVAVLQGQTTIDGALSLLRDNLDAILGALDTALTENGQRTGDLVIMTYYNPYPGIKLGPPFIPFDLDTNRDVPRFNAVISEVAAAHNVTVAPVFEAFQSPKQKLVFADFSKYNASLPISDPANQTALDYHPTEAGQQVIANTFKQTLGYSVERKIYLPVVIK